MIIAPESVLKYSAIELSQALHSRQVSAVDLMRHTLNRIDTINPQINAVVSLEQNRSKLMEKARLADELLDHSAAEKNSVDQNSYETSDHWLRGIPIAIKDLEDAQGFPTTKGCPLFGTYSDESNTWHFDDQIDDAPYVQRLRDAGAIIIAKTNTPELGAGCHSYNPIFGTTVNPIDTTKAAGGSSGGAGAALASYLFCALDGSDMMGSLRNPAGWNKLYSLRPTVEWMEEVDNDDDDDYDDNGIYKVEMPWPMSTTGPMARCPNDLAMMLQTMMPTTKKELFDATSIMSQNSKELLGILKDKKICWLADWGGDYPMEDGVLQQCKKSLDIFKQGHIDVQCLSSPPFSSKDLWDAWTTIRSHLIFNSLYEEIGGDRADVLHILKERGVKAEVLYECKRGYKFTKKEIHSCLRIVQAWSKSAEELCNRYDFLALPSSQTYAFDACIHWPKTIAGKKMDTYHRWMEVMIPVTLLGLPCVTIPATIKPGGSPIGVQIFSSKGSDAMLLQLASWYSRYSEDN